MQITKSPNEKSQCAASYDVTVVTVVFNAVKSGRKEMLLQALDSVQSQRDVNVEHVVVDGASEDGTLQLLQDFNVTSHPLTILSEKDSGIYEAMNKGIALARGKYITFLNSDDFYHNNDGLQLSFKKLEETSCSFSFAPVKVVGDVFPNNPQECPQMYLDEIIYKSVISHQSILVNTELMRQMQGFDLSYKIAADYDFLLRMVLTGKRGCLVDCDFVTYRMIGISSTNIPFSRRETSLILKSLYNKYAGAHLTDEEAYRLCVKNEFPANDLELERRLHNLIRDSFVGISYAYAIDKFVIQKKEIKRLTLKHIRHLKIIRIGIYVIVMLCALLLVIVTRCS